MPKPLTLFIKPPYASASTWSLVYGYGQAQPGTGAPVKYDQILLQTTGDGQIFASGSGKLSIRPPRSGNPDPTEQFDTSTLDASLPPVVDLYLHLSPLITPVVNAGISLLTQIVGFAYLNVDSSSLEGALAELLDYAALPLPGGTLSRSQIVNLLVQGYVEVPITVGHFLGKASTGNAPTGSRQVGFAVLAKYGPVDPSFVYDTMRSFLIDSSSDVDAFLALVPKTWPVIDPSLSTDDVINLTQTTLYSMPVLEQVRTSRNLSLPQWRQVGNNQKNLWRKRLLSRVGFALPNSNTIDPPFEFDDIDWKNIFQLEAVVEFYANYDDPWAQGAVPRNPQDPNYITVNFLELWGSNATVTDHVVSLDGAPDLSRVQFTTRASLLYDTIFLANDTTKANRLYRISNVDTAAHTVTIAPNEPAPVLTGPTYWKISQRPILVVIDSFGARGSLNGSNAKVSQAGTSTVISLDSSLAVSAGLSKVNPHFDTIYLPADTSGGKQTYRILSTDAFNITVTVDGSPQLENGVSAWSIPAGLSGELPTLTYNLGPGGPRNNDGTGGYDHYDGVLLVLQNGTVYEKFRWTSVTSAHYPVGSQNLSSVRGNHSYQIRSIRSVGDGAYFRNYCFSVVDPGASYDGVQQARFYFSTPVMDDSTTGIPQDNNNAPGKTHVRIHAGSRIMPGGGDGSAGCLVSPIFYLLRNQLIELYQAEYAAYHDSAQDLQVQKAHVVSQQAGQDLWNLSEGANPPANALVADNWNDKLAGTLWVVRPDERPLG